MRLIKPSFEIWKQEPGLEGIYKAIERAGRVCYKSEDKITEDSAKPFVDRMVKSKHGSVLEHGTVYLDIPYKDQDSFNTESFKYETNPYSKATEVPPNVVHKKWHLMVSTNYRVLVENDWLDDLKYICKPTEFHEKRITAHFICDRGILAEFTRHRVFSFSAESTRYCNYSKDKFGNEVTSIQPCWIEDAYDRWCFYESLNKAEEVYFRLLKHGWKPQQAREVLPNACKTELIMTGFVSQWKDFFMLRSNKYGKGGAHPSADELATPLYEEFVARGYIK